MPAVISKSKCNGCGICDLFCPVDVIHMEEKLAVVRYPEECWHCGSCRLDCPKGAVTFEFSPSMSAI